MQPALIAHHTFYASPVHHLRVAFAMPNPMEAVIGNSGMSRSVPFAGKFGDCGQGETYDATSCTYQGRSAVLKTIRTCSLRGELTYDDRLDHYWNSINVLTVPLEDLQGTVLPELLAYGELQSFVGSIPCIIMTRVEGPSMATLGRDLELYESDRTLAAGIIKKLHNADVALVDVGPWSFLRRGEDPNGDFVLVDVDRVVMGGSEAQKEENWLALEHWNDDIAFKVR